MVAVQVLFLSVHCANSRPIGDGGSISNLSPRESHPQTLLKRRQAQRYSRICSALVKVTLKQRNSDGPKARLSISTQLGNWQEIW